MATEIDINPPLLSQPSPSAPPPPPPSESTQQEQAPPLADDDFLTVDDLPYLDSNSFTRAELLGLCRTSKSYFNPDRDDDVVIPKINRAIFNESAGSRRQTYTRVRLRHSQHRAPRVTGMTEAIGRLTPSASVTPDTEHPSGLATGLKTHIPYCLNHIFGHGQSSTHPPLPPPPEQSVLVPSYPQRSALGAEELTIGKDVVVGKKQKLETKGKGKRRKMDNEEGIDLRTVNKKGETVDLDSLENNGDSLFAEELKRRAAGLEKEEQVLEFLGSLNGQWCSWRKKRKYVDSSELGDSLPIGWMVVLGLGRRDSFVSLNCIKYVSPSGQQFVSCKEAASFLRSHFVLTDAEHLMSQKEFRMTYDITPPSNDEVSRMTADVEGNKVSVSVPVSDMQKNDTLAGLDNLVEVQVKSRRPVSKGVIIRDGKYECQFCHKIFEERRKYNGHVGVHMRKGCKLPEVVAETMSNQSLIQVDVAWTTGTVNASIDVDKKSTPEMKVESADKTILNSYMTSSSNASANVTNHQLKLGSHGNEPIPFGVDAKLEGALDHELMHHDLKGRIESEEMTIVDDLNAKSVENYACRETDEMECGISQQKVGFAQNSSESHYAVDLIAQPHVLHSDITTSPEFFMQSLEYLPEFASGSGKGDYEFFKPDPKCQNVTGFEELGLDDLEALGYSFQGGQESAGLPGPSFDLANGSEMERGVNSVRFDSEVGISNMVGGHQLTTSCVWCQSEFQVQTNDSEIQSDTIGYMCPTCKENIPGLS